MSAATHDVPHVTIVGLGPGDPRHLTVAAAEALRTAPRIVARVAAHPALHGLGAEIIDCEDLYAAHDTFEAVYEAIAARVLEAAARHPIVYAVPGDPAVGETAAGLVRRRARDAGMRVTVLHGVSFVEPSLSLLGWDALDGLQVADATELAQRHHPHLDPDRPALVAQLHSRLLASDVKLVLLNQYPEDHPVTVVGGAGDGEARLASRPLAELDHEADFDDRTTLAVPAMTAPGSLLSLAEVIAHLRAPDGCPWDREQTHASLRPYMLEEAYEAVAAIDADAPDALSEELGDVLLQVVLHAQIAVEAGDFALHDVVRQITEKLVRRHPHVFGDGRAETSEEVLQAWDALKASERRQEGETLVDPLAGVPPDLPALMRAQLVQRKARRVLDDPAAAAPEELSTLLAETDVDVQERAERVGRVLWAVATRARAWDVDAESALREATARFEERVRAAADPDPAATSPEGRS